MVDYSQDKINERLGNHEPKILDARAFLTGQSTLWQSTKEGHNHPIMYGNVIVPKRMLDFAWENTEPIYYKGERCINFSMNFWESNPDKFYSSNPPIYSGHTKLYLNSIRADVADSIRKAYRDLNPRRNH